MKLLICLGNPGTQYALTRHNIGFMFADTLAQKLNIVFNNESKFKAIIGKGSYQNEAVWIIKPQTYMNLSGESLAALKNFYKIDIKDLFVVYDDIAIDIGTIRFKAKGSSGGHNGIKSIINHASTEVFDRLKIGIGPQPPYIKSEDYVLQNFSKDEQNKLKDILEKATEAFLYYMDTDIYRVQNKYN